MKDFEGEMDLEVLSDEQLVDLSRSGDLDAFNRLASRWEDSLYRFVRRTLGNPEEARDVCQETLTKAYQNISRLREGAKFKSWLHHIALNLCRDRFRSTRSRSEHRSLDEMSPEEAHHVVGDDQVRTMASVSPDIEARLSSMRELLGSVLSDLPAEQRTAIVLREYHGFNSEEIGEITGVPSATVRTRIFYGLKTLRRELKDRGVSGPEYLQGEMT